MASIPPPEKPVNIEPKQRWNWTPGQMSFGARDPSPLQDAAIFWRIMSQIATITMAAIMFGAVLFFARTLLVPLLSAAVVAMTLGPLADRLTQSRAPTWAPAIGIVLVLVGIVYLAITLLSDPASQLIKSGNEIGNAIRDKFQFLEQPLAALRELRGALFGSGSTVAVEVAQGSVIESVVTFITPAFAQFVLFFATLFFFLFGRPAMRRSVVGLFSSHDARLRALKIVNDIEDSLSTYLLTVTVINFALGLITIAATYLIGLPTPVIWGALAFVLNYVPYIGPGLVVVSLFGIGLLIFPSLLPALIAPFFFVTLTFIEGHFVTPNIIGRQLLLHPLAVFLSLAFWTWLWGPIGAFLATPILIMTTVAMHHLYPKESQALPG